MNTPSSRLVIDEYSEDQLDMLQEIVNIAMGQAASSLAQVLDVFIELSIPRIKLVSAEEVVDVVQDIIGLDEHVTAIRQAFYNELNGESIIFFDSNGCNDLAGLMGYENNPQGETRRELLIDVANILIGACLNGIAAQLKNELSFSPPTIIAENDRVDHILSPDKLAWSHALLMEVNFTLESSGFKSHLVIMLAEDAIKSLGESLSQFIEAY